MPAILPSIFARIQGRVEPDSAFSLEPCSLASALNVADRSDLVRASRIV